MSRSEVDPALPGNQTAEIFARHATTIGFFLGLSGLFIGLLAAAFAHWLWPLPAALGVLAIASSLSTTNRRSSRTRQHSGTAGAAVLVGALAVVVSLLAATR